MVRAYPQTCRERTPVMSAVRIERKETLTRTEATTRLSALPEALSNGGRVELPMGRSTVSVHIPEQVRTEIEVEADGDDVEIELELTWSRSQAAAGAAS
jgi:amphi-Trp domain-containing protein